MLFDAHTHLCDDRLYDQWGAIIDRFVGVGGVGLVSASIDRASFARHKIIVQKVEDRAVPCQVKTTVGFHPREVVQGHVTQASLGVDMGWVRDCCVGDDGVIVALGECGVDLHYDGGLACLSTQQLFLAAHCQLGLELGLPVVVHSRDAFLETMAVLQDFPDVVFYFHCWSYGPAELEELLTCVQDVYVGFCGNVTYKRAAVLRASLHALPQHCLLVETDAPYLTPQAVRGQQNESAFVAHTVAFVAEELCMTAETVGRVTTANARRLYGL